MHVYALCTYMHVIWTYNNALCTYICMSCTYLHVYASVYSGFNQTLHVLQHLKMGFTYLIGVFELFLNLVNVSLLILLER